MSSNRLTRLKEDAVNWWPAEIKSAVAIESPSVLLEQTLNQFCEILVGLPTEATQLRNSLKEIDMPLNLFLKHLVVLADFGGEKISRIHTKRADLFTRRPNGADLVIEINGEVFQLEVDTFANTKRVNNRVLGLDGKGLVGNSPDPRLLEDLILIVLLAGYTRTGEVDALLDLDLYKFVNNRDLLDTFLRSRYLHVSRIVAGATANGLGQILQQQVGERLKNVLGRQFVVQTSATQNLGGRKFTSDVLVHRHRSSVRFVAIEVAFQETTNSVIERKATDAPARLEGLHQLKTKSCFVLDGVGVFNRESAVRKILENSDLVVNFSDRGIRELAELIEDWC